MVIIDNLEVEKKKVLLSGIAESMMATYVGEKQYSINTLIRKFKYFVLSQSSKIRLSST